MKEGFVERERQKSGAAGAAAPSPPNFLLCKNVLKEILFTLQLLNEELNSFHSYKKHRFSLLQMQQLRLQNTK